MALVPHYAPARFDFEGVIFASKSNQTKVYACGEPYSVNCTAIATKLSGKIGERYSDTVGFVRRRISFDLLMTCVISLRGYKKTAAPDSIRDLDFNLRPVAY